MRYGKRPDAKRKERSSTPSPKRASNHGLRTTDRSAQLQSAIGNSAIQRLLSDSHTHALVIRRQLSDANLATVGHWLDERGIDAAHNDRVHIINHIQHQFDDDDFARGDVYKYIMDITDDTSVDDPDAW